MPNAAAAITEPKIAGRPKIGLLAIASIGDQDAKVTPIITGKRMQCGRLPKVPLGMPTGPTP